MPLQLTQHRAEGARTRLPGEDAQGGGPGRKRRKEPEQFFFFYYTSLFKVNEQRQRRGKTVTAFTGERKSIKTSQTRQNVKTFLRQTDHIGVPLSPGKGSSSFQELK